MLDKPSLHEVLTYYELEFPDRYGWGPMHCPSPEHDDTHMSCGVNLEEGAWYCHGCGAGGDSYALIMLRESCDFSTAVARAEEITGRSHREVRAAPFSGRTLSRGKGFKPVYRNRPRPFSRRHD